MHKKLLAAALAAAACPSIAAAQSVDLNIIGKIVPTACTPVLTGGSTIDLGGISASTLNQEAPTALTRHETELTVTCDAPAMIQIMAVDNRHGTASGNNNSWGYGLGKAPGEVNIGYFHMDFTARTIDGNSAVGLGKMWSTSAWNASSGSWWKFNGSQSNYRYSAGESLATGPKAGTTHTVALSIQPVIARADTLPTTNEIPIDGSVTFEVTQL